MFRISKHASVLLSQLLTAAVFIMMAIAVFLLPAILERYGIAQGDLRIPCTAILYLAVAGGLYADVSLHFLLMNIRRGAIFTQSSVKYLRRLSWCCFAECVIFFALMFYLSLGVLLSFACAFMGVILRVVKNVIEEAVDIKNENDYTI